jgi:hypothetical protein
MMPMSQPHSSEPSPPEAPFASGSPDGQGATDHDQVYTFNRRPRAHAPAPFRVREYARLLILRGRVQDGLFAADDVGEARLPLRWPTLVIRPSNPWCRCGVCGGHATPHAALLGRTLLCLACARTGPPRDLTEAILFTAGESVEPS